MKLWTVLSCRAVYYAVLCGSNVQGCVFNLKVWPFMRMSLNTIRSCPWHSFGFPGLANYSAIFFLSIQHTTLFSEIMRCLFAIMVMKMRLFCKTHRGNIWMVDRFSIKCRKKSEVLLSFSFALTNANAEKFNWKTRTTFSAQFKVKENKQS